MIDADAELEAQIDILYDLMVSAETEVECREKFREMVALIKKRSPEQIKRMERERRLERLENQYGST